MLSRTLEPELMDSAEEAEDYDAMEHGEVNASFADDVVRVCPSAKQVLDVGTGTARIPLLLCSRLSDAHVLGVDLATHMLALGRENVRRAGMEARIRLEASDAKKLPLADASFDAVVSNSLIHHIPEPRAALAEMWRVTSLAGGTLFVRDLFRPESEADLARLAALYTPALPLTEDARARHARQRDTFVASLRAALSVSEVEDLVRSVGITNARVDATSDRHWTLCARRSGASQ